MRGRRVRVKICGIRRVEDALVAVDAGADAIGVIQVEGTKRFIPVEDAAKIFREVPPLVTKVVVVVFDGLSEDEMIKRVRIYERIGADCIQLHGEERVELVKRLREETSLKLVKKIGVPHAVTVASEKAETGKTRGASPEIETKAEAKTEAGTETRAEIIKRIKRNAESYGDFVDAILLDTAETAVRTSHSPQYALQQHASQPQLKGSPQLGGTGMTHDWRISANIASSLRKPLILAGGLNPENVHHAIMHVRPFAVDVSSGVENESGWKDADKVRKFVNAVLSASFTRS